ncbi:MAG: bifunctional hydroxymethylpyrimidine kinase/phosphomethylpyrimidine kinase [Acidobacteriia bacterium]|nr:bifunctional hydroxymethylpyrimidine kinase/phosphomethylpyrimidine kinase [Terriglobia bacterium]
MPVALSIAGSDPSGGAGIQADLKTFHQFGVYGEAVITLITVQNSYSAARVELLPADLVREQVEAVLEDIPPDAAKTGALGSAEIVQAVAKTAHRFGLRLVVDPVLIGKHGQTLADAATAAAIREDLLRYACLVTPNLPEAEVLSGITIGGPPEARRAAERIRELGAGSVLIKGGHAEGPGPATDVLLDETGWHEFSLPRLDSRHTHGTGCTLSAAITAGLAAGLELKEAVARAKQYVNEAIRTAPQLGRGCGPLNHHAGFRG